MSDIDKAINKEYERLITVAQALQNQNMEAQAELEYVRALLAAQYLYGAGLIPKSLHDLTITEIYKVAGLDTSHPDADVFA
jgi:hypothetical protein